MDGLVEAAFAFEKSNLRGVEVDAGAREASSDFAFPVRVRCFARHPEFDVISDAHLQLVLVVLRISTGWMMIS